MKLSAVIINHIIHPFMSDFARNRFLSYFDLHEGGLNGFRNLYLQLLLFIDFFWNCVWHCASLGLTNRIHTSSGSACVNRWWYSFRAYSSSSTRSASVMHFLLAQPKIGQLQRSMKNIENRLDLKPLSIAMLQTYRILGFNWMDWLILNLP